MNGKQDIQIVKQNLIICLDQMTDLGKTFCYPRWVILGSTKKHCYAFWTLDKRSIHVVYAIFWTVSSFSYLNCKIKHFHGQLNFTIFVECGFVNIIDFTGNANKNFWSPKSPSWYIFCDLFSQNSLSWSPNKFL